MEFDIKILGVRIREERMKRKLTIEELAEIINVSPSFLGLVERGDRGVSIEKLCKIAEVFELSIDSLLNTNQTSNSKYDKIKVLLHDLNDNQLDFVANMIKLLGKHFK
ncbi:MULTISPECIES: helix-turn-helix transcriptional regulator [unclassified Clostridium]|uniref:helix-turn-helix domain-containing protein n=1 Tax=unclassified Clostridium TaxID=2614128 RepID=UPI0002986262|nr:MULTISPECIES: helix-turn-helix transcriptional regulator [unclassified Clostridium]EKQ57236.1 MAG: putative transcriptional regulator [Clostridium sp. Maddingley MBC34-26]